MAGFRSKSTKPTTLPEWFGTILDPGTAKKIAGWLDEEVVPHQWLNWFFNLVYQVVRYLRVTGEDASAEDFIVSPTSPTSSVLIAAGRIRKFEKNLDVAAQTFAWPAAPTPAGDRRIDVLTLNDLGTPIVIAGTEVTNPTLPVPPLYAGKFPLAEILLNGHATTTPVIMQANVVSITRIGAVATITTDVAHGLVAADAIYVFGSDQPEYNGLFNIDAVPLTTTFEITVGGTPATPATGTMIATTIKDVRGFLSNTQGEPTIDLAVVERFDLSDSIGPLVNIVWPWAAPAKMSFTATAPTGAVVGVAWSPGDEFLALSHFTAPFLSIYQRDATVLRKLIDPAVTPTGIGEGIAWSLNGEFLAVAHAIAPFITIYQRDGNTFTKLPVSGLDDMGFASGLSCAWSPNGEFLAVGHADGVFITIYQRNGTTFTKIVAPLDTPLPGKGQGVAWTPDGRYLTIGHAVAPYVTTYRRSGISFVKIASPDIPPTGDVFGVAWSPNGKYLATAHTSAPYMSVYLRSGEALSRLTPPATPGSDAFNVAWSPNGEFLAVTHGSTPFISIYQRDELVLTKLTVPADIPLGVALGVAWNHNGEFLAVGHHTTSPFLIFYQTTGVFPAERMNLRILAPVKS